MRAIAPLQHRDHQVEVLFNRSPTDAIIFEPGATFSEPDVLIAMNLPSLSAYQARVRAGGEIIFDASLIRDMPEREDVCLRALPATRLAADAGLEGLSNMILLGAFLLDCLPLSESQLRHALEQTVPKHKAHLVEANQHAIALGKQEAAQVKQEAPAQTCASARPRKAG